MPQAYAPFDGLAMTGLGTVDAEMPVFGGPSRGPDADESGCVPRLHHGDWHRCHMRPGRRGRLAGAVL